MNGFWNQCGQHRKNISLHVAGLLPEAELGRLAAHLAGCAGCRAVHAEMKQVTGLLAGWEKDLDQLQPDWSARRRWIQSVLTAKVSASGANASSNAAMAWIHDLFWPHRHAWTGMAAIWLVLFVINYGNSSPSRVTMTASNQALPETFQAMAEERQMLAELSLTPTAQPAGKPRLETRPHSQKNPVNAAG